MRDINKFGFCPLLVLMLMLLSCDKGTKDNKFQHFDLTGFIASEAEKLSNLNPVVEKEVFLNGRSESKRATIENWTNELGAFSEADINKKSFLGKYNVDSTYNQPGNLMVLYSTTEEKFRTKRLVVEFRNDRLSRLAATVGTDNVLYSSRQELLYEPDSGYSISGKQTIRFLDIDTFHVYVKF